MNTGIQSTEIVSVSEAFASIETTDTDIKMDITNDLEALARELCILAGHDPDASVFPGTPETVRTRYDRAYIIPPAHKLIQAWQLFMPDAIAVRDLKARGLLG